MIDFNDMNTNEGYKPIDTHVHKSKPKTKAVAPKDPFDLDRAKKAFAGYEKQIQEIKKAMDDFEIKTDEDAATCTEAVAKTASLKKDMEDVRKQKIKKPDSFVRAVNRFVKIYRDQVEAIVKAGKSKIGQYEYQKEIKRRKKEKKAQDAADKLQAQINDDAKKLGIEPVQIPAMVSAPTTSPVRTESGSTSTKMVWDWEVVSISDVPPIYLMVNPKKLDEAVDAGIRNIPGIKIFEKPKVTVRTA